MDTGQHLETSGLRRAACLAASIAGARGPDVQEIAEEAMARLLMQDGLVNNPKAWVRSTATRLVAQSHARRCLRADDLLGELTPLERNLVVGERAGYRMRELAQLLRLREDVARTMLAEANHKVRRSSERLADAEH